MMSASNIPKNFQVSLSLCILSFSWFNSSIPSVMCLFLHIICMADFFMPNFIPMY